MSAAYFDPKKARRNARREAAFPSKPSIRFLADNAALFYDPESEVSCVMLNAPILETRFDFSKVGRMTREQAHAVVSQMDDATVAMKAHYRILISTPTDAETDAKNRHLK